jgi:hypothetical protein
MISRLIVAIVYAIIVGLVLLLIGLVLVALGIPILATIGHFLKQWCWVLGFLAGVLSFFGGWSFPRVGPPA